jgi:hypothetical protein
VLPLLLATLGALATARLTRLVTADRLTLPVRRAMLTRVREGGQLEYLLSCGWCASFWIALPVAALTWALIPEVTIGAARETALDVLTALAFSYVAGRLAQSEVEA